LNTDVAFPVDAEQTTWRGNPGSGNEEAATIPRCIFERIRQSRGSRVGLPMTLDIAGFGASQELLGVEA